MIMYIYCKTGLVASLQFVPITQNHGFFFILFRNVTKLVVFDQKVINLVKREFQRRGLGFQ